MLPFANNPEIEALLAQYSLPDEERKRMMLGNALLGLGMGIAGARRGNELGGAAFGLAQGTQQGAQQVSDARANQYAGLKTRMGLQEYIDKEKARKQEADDQAEVEKIFAGGPQLQNMGPGGPTPQNAAAVAPMGQVEKYRKAAEMYAGRGKVEDAAKLNAIADKLEEEYSTSPQTVRGADGKLQLAQFGKRGGIKVADGMTPAEKLHFASTGGMAGVGMDPYSGAQVSRGLPVTMDPAQADASKRGWAQYQLSKAAADRAAKEGSSGGKPQMVNGQWVFPPDAQNPTGRAVTPEGIATGSGKALTESQAKATAFVNQMQNATSTINDLESKGFDGKTTQQQAQIVAAGSEGVPFVPGSAALPRFVAGKEAQQYYQAELQWTEGALRFMTGANAPKEEVIRNAATYFPRPGDRDDVIKRKKEARQNMEESIRLAAGAGSEKVPQKNSGPEKTIVRTGTNKKTGKRVILYSDGTQVEQ